MLILNNILFFAVDMERNCGLWIREIITFLGFLFLIKLINFLECPKRDRDSGFLKPVVFVLSRKFSRSGYYK